MKLFILSVIINFGFNKPHIKQILDNVQLFNRKS